MLIIYLNARIERCKYDYSSEGDHNHILSARKSFVGETKYNTINHECPGSRALVIFDSVHEISNYKSAYMY